MIFSAHYFPSIRYMADFLQSENPILDGNENIQKQTYRNRCYILGPNGRQILVVPTARNNNSRKMKDIQISYAENWQKEHFKSLEAAYRRSPYFEFYEDYFHDIFDAKPNYLFDLNINILERLLKILQAEKEIQLTQEFKKGYEYDFREKFNAKEFETIKPYAQVFEEKMDFVHDLSCVDLICNQGPQASLYLKNLIQK